jgi:hypothetical protein
MENLEPNGMEWSGMKNIPWNINNMEWNINNMDWNIKKHGMFIVEDVESTLDFQNKIQFCCFSVKINVKVCLKARPFHRC